MRHLTVYARSYCHLCTDMVQGLATQRERLGFSVEVVDIEGDPALEAAYGERVPVLTAGGQEICHYFLDINALERYFGNS